ncbi:MAG: alpha-hydroxy acid oxidase [Pseudomonadota bacterium]
MRLKHCHNTSDFRRLAKQRLPAPLFHYIDGGADDESTLRRNVSAFERYDLVPNVLRGVSSIDLSTKVLGQTLQMPLLFSPTAMQRLFHHDGEWAVADAAAEFGSMYGLSTIGTRSIEEMGQYNNASKYFQIYIHNDPRLNEDLIARCKAAKFDALALTVDTVVGGNRERDLRTGMTTPPRLTPRSLLSFARHWRWTLPYLLKPGFTLPNVSDYISAGHSVSSSVADYIDSQMKVDISWDDAAKLVEQWDGPFIIKGVMSVDDAKRARDIGASAIMVSNHGGRQLDGSRSPFDQISEIADAVGGQIEIILDGGIRRGTHVLKALASGADACSGGRFYLYALAAAGRAGVQRAAQLMQSELERDMRLMGCESLKKLSSDMIAARPGQE